MVPPRLRCGRQLRLRMVAAVDANRLLSVSGGAAATLHAPGSGGGERFAFFFFLFFFFFFFQVLLGLVSRECSEWAGKGGRTRKWHTGASTYRASSATAPAVAVLAHVASLMLVCLW